jgi:hypothetical protein
MFDFTALVPFLERTRWLMFQACTTDGVDAGKFSLETGLSEKRIRNILFSSRKDIGDMNLREIAVWFHCSAGCVPEFTLVPHGKQA